MKVLIAGNFYPRDRVAEIIENGEYKTVLGEMWLPLNHIKL